MIKIVNGNSIYKKSLSIMFFWTFLLLISLILEHVFQTGVPPGGACTNTSNCTDNITNTECKGGKCQCTAAYYPIKNTCVNSKYIAEGSIYYKF